MNIGTRTKLMGAVMICLSLLSSCKHAPQENGGQSIARKTMTVRKSDQVLLTDFSARLKGKEFVEVRPQVSGMITGICFKEGDPVRKGQVLFIIDQVPYQAALQTAEAQVESVRAQLATAELQCQSKEELFRNEVISEYDLMTARNQVAECKARLAQAEAQLVQARNNLSYTEVKSPVNGVTSMVPYRVGALVSSSIAEPLVTVSDISRMYAYFSMSENQVLNVLQRHGSIEKVLEEMNEVGLRLSNGSLYPVKGKIDAISGTIDERTGSVPIRASFANPDGLLRNGAACTIEFSTPKKDCIIIPQAATYELQDKIFAYKVIDGKAVMTPIEVFHLNNGSDYVVESGLEEGDVIIAEGAGLVKAGEAIQCMPID